MAYIRRPPSLLFITPSFSGCIAGGPASLDEYEREMGTREERFLFSFC